MHLTETGRGGGLVSETGELRLPVGTEFACHATAHEIPAHRRGVGLEVREFRGVLGGQRVGHGGQELRHLHQRALQAAQDGAQILGVRGAVGLDAEHTLARNACGDAAHGTGRARHAAKFAEQIAAVRHGGVRGRAVVGEVVSEDEDADETKTPPPLAGGGWGEGAPGQSCRSRPICPRDSRVLRYWRTRTTRILCSLIHASRTASPGASMCDMPSTSTTSRADGQ